MQCPVAQEDEVCECCPNLQPTTATHIKAAALSGFLLTFIFEELRGKQECGQFFVQVWVAASIVACGIGLEKKQSIFLNTVTP